MKNKYFKFLIASVLMSSLPAIAQVSTYSFSQQEGVYTPLETPEVVAEVSGASMTERLDTGFYTRELPFTFQFNGVAYNSVHIYTDGYVTFGSWTSPLAHHKPITHSASLHEGVIAVFNDDLEGLDLEGKKGQISFKIVGEAPNREAVIQWKNFTRYSVMGNYTERYELNFQLRLSEGTNVIKKVFDISVVGQPDDRYITSGLRGNSPADFATRKAEGDDVNNWSITTQGTAAADAILTKPNTLPSSGFTFIWTPAGVAPTPTPTPTPTDCVAEDQFDFDFENMTVVDLFEDYCWNANYTTYPTVSVTNAAGGSGNITLPDNVLQIYKGATTTNDIILVMPEVSTTNGTHRLSFDIELALSGSPMGITGNEKIVVGTMSNQSDFSTFTPTGHEFAVNATGTFTTPAITFPAGHKYVAIRFDFGTQPHKAMVLDNVKWEESASTSIFDNLEVNLYPNPVQSTLNVEGLADIKTLSVYDIHGRLIMEQHHTKQIQVNHLSQGVYLLRVTTLSGQNTTLKFVKK